jgi:hypothetical protein
VRTRPLPSTPVSRTRDRPLDVKLSRGERCEPGTVPESLLHDKPTAPPRPELLELHGDRVSGYHPSSRTSTNRCRARLAGLRSGSPRAPLTNASVSCSRRSWSFTSFFPYEATIPATGLPLSRSQLVLS